MVFETVKKGKYFLAWMVIVSCAAGIISFALVGRRYTAVATILPSSTGSQRLLIPEAGFLDISRHLGMEPSGGLLPLYPDILRSRLVGKDVLQSRYVFCEDGQEVSKTLAEHLEITNEDAALAALSKAAKFWIDRGSSALVIEVTTDNPELSSLVVNSYIRRLEKFNREERRSASVEVYRYVEDKLDGTRQELEQAEERLKSFRERNRNYTGSTEPGLRMQHRRLMRDVEIKQALYIELGKQLKKAALEVERDTPILSVLDHGLTPERPSWPRPVQYILSITLAGAGCGALYLIAAQRLKKWKTGRDREAVERLLDELRSDLKNVPFFGGRSIFKVR